MSVKIRVYPAGTAGAYGGVGAYGGAVSAQTYYNQKLSSQQQISNLQLQYERALWNEKINTAVLEERAKNPYAAYGNQGYGAGLAGAYGLGGLSGLTGFSGLGGGLPIGAGLPMGVGGGSGQTNITNQTSTSAGTQSVSNVNNNVQTLQQVPRWGTGGFGGGGFLSGLLGALI